MGLFDVLGTAASVLFPMTAAAPYLGLKAATPSGGSTWNTFKDIMSGVPLIGQPFALSQQRKAMDEAQSKAAADQRAALERMMALQQQMYASQQAGLAPYQQFGQGSLADLARAQAMYERGVVDPSSYTRSPGYDFRLQQGMEGINRNAAMRGKLDSGQTLMALNQYAQGVAAQDYQNWLNNQRSLAGMYGGNVQMGLGAAGQLGQYAGDYARNLGGMYGAQGDIAAQLALAQGQNQAGYYQGLQNFGNQLFNRGMQGLGMMAGGPAGMALAGGMQQPTSGTDAGSYASNAGIQAQLPYDYGQYGGQTYNYDASAAPWEQDYA